MAFNTTLSPAQAEFFIKPGENYIRAFNLTNNSNTTLTLSTAVKSWSPKNNSGEVSYDDFLPDNPNLSFTLNNTDLKLGQKFILPPQETKQVVLKIKTTSNLSYGDYYYTLFFEQITEAKAKAQIGAHLIFSSVSDKSIQEDFEISQFTTSPQIKDIFLTPINFNIIYKNNSPHFTKINGQFTISKNNQIIKKYTILPDTLLGNNTRKAVCLDTTNQQNEEYPTIVPCSLQTPFWPGFYQAQVTYSLNNETKTQEISFFTFPYALVLFIIALTITLKLLLTPTIRKKTN
jgi:hypothetical protein